MRILVAEDDSNSRLALESMLSRWGYEVAAAADGREAWDILCSAKSPQLAILDWMMPGLDGLAICQRLREMRWGNAPYVILLSARGSKADLVERKYWNEYMKAYEACLAATSTRDAPWYVVPADDKRNARLIVSAVILDTFKRLEVCYPKLTPERKRELRAIRRKLV